MKHFYKNTDLPVSTCVSGTAGAGQLSLRKKPYLVDLVKLQSLCETNYHQLRKLTGDYQRSAGIILGQQNHEAHIELVISETTRYTTLLKISQLRSPHNWLLLPTLKVRAYHDVKMAEVIAADKHRYLHPRYIYPNQPMFQPDEKYQLNWFLSESLSHYLQNGYQAANSE